MKQNHNSKNKTKLKKLTIRTNSSELGGGGRRGRGGEKDDLWLVNPDDMIYRLRGLRWQGPEGRVTLEGNNVVM